MLPLARQCLIQGIDTVEIIIESRDKIRLHNVIHEPTFNVSLFSIKQQMIYIGCYEHSENYFFSIKLPSAIINAYKTKYLEFLVRKPSSNHSSTPSFDEATSTIYAPDITTITFDCPANPTAYEDTITSTIKSKFVKHVP